MPVYNAERYLKQAVDSILDQTFSDFELIAINDGSTDRSGDILEHYQKVDNRVTIVQRENRGLVATLNEGIDMAQGEYIARQDSDDISFSTRFEHQVEALDAHPQVVLVTGSFEVFDEQDEYLYREVLPAHDEDIKRAMYLRNPIGHGSVMFRRASCVQVGLYSDKCGPTEDFELWARLAEVGKFMAIETAAFHWRVNTTGITSTHNNVQIELMKQHIHKLWKKKYPTILNSKQLRQRGREYYQNYPRHGVAMKENMLADNTQLAVKMMRRGRPLLGIRQLLAVALVGRSGIRAVYDRSRHINKGTAAAIQRRLSNSKKQRSGLSS